MLKPVNLRSDPTPSGLAAINELQANRRYPKQRDLDRLFHIAWDAVAVTDTARNRVSGLFLPLSR